MWNELGFDFVPTSRALCFLDKGWLIENCKIFRPTFGCSCSRFNEKLHWEFRLRRKFQIQRATRIVAVYLISFCSIHNFCIVSFLAFVRSCITRWISTRLDVIHLSSSSYNGFDGTSSLLWVKVFRIYIQAAFVSARRKKVKARGF